MCIITPGTEHAGVCSGPRHAGTNASRTSTNISAVLTIDVNGLERLGRRHGGARPQVRLAVQEHIPLLSRLILQQVPDEQLSAAEALRLPMRLVTMQPGSLAMLMMLLFSIAQHE